MGSNVHANALARRSVFRGAAFADVILDILQQLLRLPSLHSSIFPLGAPEPRRATDDDCGTCLSEFKKNLSESKKSPAVQRHAEQRTLPNLLLHAINGNIT